MSLLWGLIGGLAVIYTGAGRGVAMLVSVGALCGLALAGLAPVVAEVGLAGRLLVNGALGLIFGLSQPVLLAEVTGPATQTRHAIEDAVIRFLTGFGYIFFTAIVAIPFYVMVMTSLKSQSELLKNPLDFSIDLSKGWDLFRSYVELFRDSTSATTC